RLYGEILGAAAGKSAAPGWATILGLEPPFNTKQVRSAYRTLSKATHPDIGGSHSEFVRLRKAYEEARHYCEANGL
ncbi:J domain-containing protein, partial [Singulisphaera rosea]